jgi:hypothetical protein
MQINSARLDGHRVSSVCLTAFLGFCGLLAGVGLLAGPILPVWIHLLAGCVTITLLPGMGILRWIRRRDSIDLLEALPLCFAYSFIAITALSAGAIALHISSRTCAWLLLGTALLLQISAFLRKRASTEPIDLTWTASRGCILLGILAVGFMLYPIGGLLTLQIESMGGGEEGLHLLILRRWFEHTDPSLQNLMWRPGIVYTYGPAPYHFMLALISHVSAVDPVAVAVKFRVWATLLALTGYYAAALGLFRSRRLAEGVLLLGIALVGTHHGGVRIGYALGILSPVFHLGDFGVGVLLPVALALCVRFLRPVRPGSHLASWKSGPARPDSP